MSKGRKIRDKVLPLSVKYAGETINFTYKIGRLDRAWEDRMNTAVQTGDFDGLMGALGDVIASWSYEDDFVKDDDSPVGYRLATDSDAEDQVETRKVPLSAEWLEAAMVPTPIIGMIRDKMAEDASTGGAQAKKG